MGSTQTPAERSTADLTDVSAKSIANDGMAKDIDVEKQDLGDFEKQALDVAAPVPTEEAPKDGTLVEFDGHDDPGNPKNWTTVRRSVITMSMSMMTFVVTFSSSIFASALGPVTEEFGISTTVAALGVALFLMVREHSQCARVAINVSRVSYSALYSLARRAKFTDAECRCSAAT